LTKIGILGIIVVVLLWLCGAVTNGLNGGVFMAGWMLLGELAKDAKISDSTARRYANLFSAYLKSRSFGRTTKYLPDCLPVFLRVAELYQEGKNTIEILDMLPEEFPLADDLVEKAPEVLQPMEVIANPLPVIDQYGELKESFERMHTELTTHSEPIRAGFVAYTQKINDLIEILDEQSKEISELKGHIIILLEKEQDADNSNVLELISQAKGEILQEVKQLQESTTSEKWQRNGLSAEEGSDFSGAYRQQIGRFSAELDRELPGSTTVRTTESQMPHPYVRESKDEQQQEVPWWKLSTKWKMRGRKKREKDRERPGKLY
jgi:hypothetical protein